MVTAEREILQMWYIYIFLYVTIIDSSPRNKDTFSSDLRRYYNMGGVAFNKRHFNPRMFYYVRWAVRKIILVMFLLHIYPDYNLTSIFN